MIIRKKTDRDAVLGALLASPEITEREYNKLSKLRAETALVVSVDRFKSRRSLDQNAMYWKWLTIFADHIGEDSSEDLHEALKARFLGAREVPKVGMVPRSTTGLTVDSFVKYMDAVKRLALEFDCYLPSTDEEWRQWEQQNER